MQRSTYLLSDCQRIYSIPGQSCQLRVDMGKDLFLEAIIELAVEARGLVDTDSLGWRLGGGQ
jgi:hypothetical protein